MTGTIGCKCVNVYATIAQCAFYPTTNDLCTRIMNRVFNSKDNFLDIWLISKLFGSFKIRTQDRCRADLFFFFKKKGYDKFGIMSVRRGSFDYIIDCYYNLGFSYTHIIYNNER